MPRQRESNDELGLRLPWWVRLRSDKTVTWHSKPEVLRQAHSIIPSN
jgi:hypothetical protein